MAGAGGVHLKNLGWYCPSKRGACATTGDGINPAPWVYGNEGSGTNHPYEHIVLLNREAYVIIYLAAFPREVMAIVNNTFVD